MHGMNPYEFEKMLAIQSAMAARQIRKAWMLMGLGTSQQMLEDRKLKRLRMKETAR